jgi:hypothetical protein
MNEVKAQQQQYCSKERNLSFLTLFLMSLCSPRMAKSMKAHDGGTPSNMLTAQLSPPPSILKGFSPLSTPAGLQTPPVTPAAAFDKPAQPITQLAMASEKKNANLIQQLHPYQDSWSIKVCIQRCGTLV